MPSALCDGKKELAVLQYAGRSAGQRRDLQHCRNGEGERTGAIQISEVPAGAAAACQREIFP